MGCGSFTFSRTLCSELAQRYRMPKAKPRVRPELCHCKTEEMLFSSCIAQSKTCKLCALRCRSSSFYFTLSEHVRNHSLLSLLTGHVFYQVSKKTASRCSRAPQQCSSLEVSRDQQCIANFRLSSKTQELHRPHHVHSSWRTRGSSWGGAGRAGGAGPPGRPRPWRSRRRRCGSSWARCGTGRAGPGGVRHGATAVLGWEKGKGRAGPPRRNVSVWVFVSCCQYKFRDLTVEEVTAVSRAHPNFSFSMNTYSKKGCRTLRGKWVVVCPAL